MDEANINYSIVKEEYRLEARDEQEYEKYPEVEMTDADEDVCLEDDEDLHSDAGDVGDAELVQFEITEIDQESDTESECLICLICEKTFEKVKQLKAHMQVHENQHGNEQETPEETYNCPTCPEVYESEKLLKKHFKTHTRKGGVKIEKSESIEEKGMANIYPCAKCDTISKSFIAFRNHMQKHSVSKIVNCCLCNKKYISKYILKRHIQDEHTGERTMKGNPLPKKFKCPVCFKGFINKHHMRKHFIVHSDYKAFECNICGVRFKRKDYLKEHSTKHDETQSKTCPQCKKSFSTAICLRKHLLRCNPDRDTKCNLCNNTYKSKHGLSIHLKVHMNKVTPATATAAADETPKITLKCKTCQKSFKTKRGLTLHTATHMTKPPIQKVKVKVEQPPVVVLPENPKITKKIKSATTKSKCYPFVCELCNRGFFTEYNYTTHLVSHSDDRPHECPNCPSKFKRKDHLLEHLPMHSENRQLHNCEICGKGAYLSRRSVRLHMSHHHSTYCRICVKDFKKKILLDKHLVSYHNKKI